MPAIKKSTIILLPLMAGSVSFLVFNSFNQNKQLVPTQETNCPQKCKIEEKEITPSQPSHIFSYGLFFSEA